jgi:MoaA/NifB/PqqE/SkfB family radical SAM enzyme
MNQNNHSFCQKCRQKETDTCTAGKDKFVIAPDGRVIPCEAFKFLLELENQMFLISNKFSFLI